jgi:hypothetical protein
MVWPLVVVAAATAAAQYYQSEKARGANDKRLKEIEAEFRKLVPPEYNLSPMSTPAYIKSKIPEPTMDMSNITFDQFQLVGKYMPQAAPLIAEKRPELLKENATTKEGRDAMVGALRKMRGIATSDFDPEFQQKQAEASARSRMEANSRSKSILQDAARRGNLDGGSQLMAELQGSSDSMASAAAASRSAATEAYRNKLSALRESASMGKDLRSDDLSMQSSNNAAINSFNERTSRSAQAWADNKAKMQNDASRYNLENEQDISNKNTGLKNEGTKYNRERLDGLMKTLYDMRARERDSQNEIIANEANWKKGERDRIDTLKDRSYGYETDKLGATSGVGYRQMENTTGAAQDRNTAIQGIGNAGMNYLQYSEGSKDANAAQNRADRRAYFEKYGAWPDDNASTDGGGKKYGSYA